MKKLIAIVLSLAVALSFTACSQPSVKDQTVAPQTSENQSAVAQTADAQTTAAQTAAAQTDKEYVLKKGTLIVGITDFKPMDYKDDKGNWIGFDADMANAFGKDLGVNVEFVEIDWDNKILELNAKSIDCVWNGITLTDEVKNSMECSIPYCDNAQVAVVPASKAAQYKDKNSIAGLTFAVESGSAGEKIATELGYKCTAVQNQAAALMEVAAGTSDACVIDLMMAGAMIGEGTSYPNLTHTVALNSEQYGVGFRKGSDLAAALNAFFAKAYADGSLMACAKTYGVQDSIIIK